MLGLVPTPTIPSFQCQASCEASGAPRGASSSLVQSRLAHSCPARRAGPSPRSGSRRRALCPELCGPKGWLVLSASQEDLSGWPGCRQCPLNVRAIVCISFQSFCQCGRPHCPAPAPAPTRPRPGTPPARAPQRTQPPAGPSQPWAQPVTLSAPSAPGPSPAPAGSSEATSVPCS